MSGNCQWDRTPKARKVHKCDVCGIEIPKGAIYHKQSGIHDGYPYTWKAHQDCAEMYWRIMKDTHCLDHDDMIDVFDIEQEFIESYRGYYPHVVTRMELMRHRWD